jgi:transcription antitermination factor NusG
MNIVLDFNPADVSEESLQSVKPKTIGWKAYDLLQTGCFLKSLGCQEITIPDGVIISSTLYNDSLKKIVRKYLENALKKAIKRDRGLFEDLAEKLGEQGVTIDKGEETKVERLIDEIIKKHKLKNVLQKIAVEEEKEINFVHPLSDVLSEWFDDIKNEISQKIPTDVLNSLQDKISRSSSPVIYLRSSSYSKRREEWWEHTGVFGSIPCFASDLDKKKIEWIYSGILLSEKAVQSVMKTGIDIFSMAILAQFVDKNIVVSGKVISTTHKNDCIDLCVECKEGFDILPATIKELVHDGSVEEVNVKGESYVSNIDGRNLSFQANSVIYRKRFDIKNKRFLDHPNQKPRISNKRNVCIVVDAPYRGFKIERTENREISEETLNKLYHLVRHFFEKWNEILGQNHWHVKIEYAVTHDGEIQIVQCNPFLEERNG